MKIFLSLLCFLLFLPLAFALPKGFSLFERMPVKKEMQVYAEPEYESSQDYQAAYLAGECSSVWLWTHLKEDEKRALVEALKHLYEERDQVLIRHNSAYYVERLDELIVEDPQAKHYSLGVIFRAAAVMANDFDEGRTYEETAQYWLGTAYPFYQEFKKNGS